MKLYVWINENDLETFNSLLNNIHLSNHLDNHVVAFNKRPQHGKYFQVEVDYDKYVSLKDNKKIS